jgi:uncharacterized protein (DUF169 family)
MDIYKTFEGMFGAPWTGVSFHDALPSFPEAPSDCARLCEAIGQAFRKDMIVDIRSLDCPGGLRSVGVAIDDNKMAQEMARRAPMPIGNARRIIRTTPRLKQTPAYISIGRLEHPEILISYLPPEGAMKLLRRWQQVFGRRLKTDLSASTAVCAATVGAYLNEKMLFSFGCPDSREYGGITSHQMVAALPVSLATRLIQEGTENAHV